MKKRLMEFEHEEDDIPYVPQDFSNSSRAEICAMLKNQILTQAMLAEPQPSILLLASKIYGVADEDGSADGDVLEQMTTDELMNKLKSMKGLNHAN